MTLPPPTLQLTADRDSVCAGDDSDPHAQPFAIAGDTTVLDLITAANAVCRLASIAGDRATWVVEAGGHGGRPIAVVAQQWDGPRLLVPSATTAADVFAAQKPVLFFRYDRQTDPDAVHAALATGAPVPGRRV